MSGRKSSAKLTSIALALLLIPAIVFMAGCGGGRSTTVTVGGSTTVQPVAEKLANAFMDENPDVAIIVQGGGSSTGVSKCADGTFDIGAASRELKPGEPELVTHLLARDGIAIVTHTGNGIAGLTGEQLRDIYSGAIKNWDEIGGPDESIIVIAREEGSGTRDAFEELVMEGKLITAEAILQTSNGALRTAVANTPYSIGFISFGYLTDSVKSLSVDGVAGTAENVRDGSYPIVRPLYFLTAEQPQGEVEAFIDYCLGGEGQDIVEDEGYIRVD